MGTGIVFVVLVAIWVVYFVQYWSRRREHLATARSVESFAEAMRVLERRPALRTPSGHRVSSAYAMSPARVVSAHPAPRPQVIAKPHPTTPTPSRGGATSMPTSTSSRPTPQRSRPPRPRSASTAAPISPSRKVRGLALLGALVATLVLAGLAAFVIVLWWVPLIGVAAVCASFLWLRSGVQGEIAARRATISRRPARPAGQRPESTLDRGAWPAGGSAGDHGVSSPVAGSAAPELIETTSVTATVQERPDGWDPVPVPPPTYTLKAKAERPAASAAEVAPEAATAPAAHGESDRAVTREADAQRATAYGM